MKKYWVYFVVAIILVMPLSACLKAASTAPVTAPTATGLPFPLPVTEDAMKNILSSTQTAIALSGTPMVVATATLVPGAATSTPLPSPTPTHGVIPTVTRPSTYTIQKGEFPYCIARRFDVSPGGLLSLNGLSSASFVTVGAVLKIPATGHWDNGPRSLKAHPATHTVVAGETIYTVACLYGDVDPSGIIAANGLQAPYTLTSGQKLQIP